MRRVPTSKTIIMDPCRVLRVGAQRLKFYAVLAQKALVSLNLV